MAAIFLRFWLAFWGSSLVGILMEVALFIQPGGFLGETMDGIDA